MSYDDRVLAERLRTHGIVLHTAPQARTRLPYDQRPGCQNFGTCDVCPIGVRYSPNHHLAQAVATGRCRVHTNTSVRRVVLDKAGRARALVYQANDAATEQEHAARVIIIAAGTIESARLLLLSSSVRHPDGLPHGEHVGKHLVFHHIWRGRLRYAEAFQPGNVGPHTAQSHQFLEPPGRGKHGSIKVDFSSDATFMPAESFEEKAPSEVVELYRQMRHWHILFLQAETAPSPQKFVTLSDKRDRFGDPLAHVHYESSDFDHETYRFGRQIFDKFVAATRPAEAELASVGEYSSGAHHMGTCRMDVDVRDSVVDQFGRVHGSPNLFVVGGSNFAGSSAMQPTLTMVALAIRAARHIVDRVL